MWRICQLWPLQGLHPVEYSTVSIYAKGDLWFASQRPLGYNGPIVLREARMKLSVIMPVYNEINTIAEILRRVRAVELAVPTGYGQQNGAEVSFEREIVVVDDGSTDGTRDYLRSVENDPDMVVVFHEKNQGKGAAVRTGLLHARGDVMLIQDADLEYDPRDYPRLLQPIVEGRSQ